MLGSATTQGQLGDGSVDSRLAPMTVPGLTGFAQVAAGGDHTCALTSRGAGTVMCWGFNNDGEVGAGDTNIHTVPTPWL